MTKELKLLGCYSTVKVDDEDYDLVREYRWCLRLDHKGRYAVCTFNKKTLYIHRLIMSPPDNMVVHHKNGDGLDNRRENLEILSSKDNSRFYNRRGLNSNNSTGAIGVYPSGKYWTARLREVHLGSFRTFEEALKARQDAELRHINRRRP